MDKDPFFDQLSSATTKPSEAEDGEGHTTSPTASKTAEADIAAQLNSFWDDTEVDDDDTIVIPKYSMLMDLVEDDIKEYDDFEIDEFLPKTKYNDKSYMKLQEFVDGIMTDLKNAQSTGIQLEEVREEFEFIWDAIKKSHDNLESLLHKDLQISVEVADIMAKTRNLIQVAENDPEKAVNLGKRLRVAGKLVDISEAEEHRNSAYLEELESAVVELNKNIAAAANMEGRAELNELIKIRRKLAEEKESLLKEMGRIRTSLFLLQERKERQAEEKISFKEMIKFSEAETIANMEAIERETARKERIVIAIEETFKNTGVKGEELAQMDEQMLEANSRIEGLERLIRDQKVINDVAGREADAAWAKHEKLRGDVEAQVALVERFATDALRRQNELHTKEDEIALLKMEGTRLERQRLTNVQKCEAMQQTLEALEQEREDLRNKIIELEKDLEKAQKKLEASRKDVEELDKQRTVINRNLQRAHAVTGEHENQMKISAVAINNLEGELEGYQREITIQMDTVYRLERERDYYSHEATKLAQVVSSRVEYIKRLDLMILEQKRRVAEMEDTVKTEQQTYESVVLEKIFFERILRDTVNEITQCAKTIRNIKFDKRALDYRETNLKNAIISEDERRERLSKEEKFYKTEAHRMLHLQVDCQRETEALEVEKSTLSSAVATAEMEISKQRYYAMGAASRKENYHRKLMKKTQELKETWEKWRTLHSMVRIGASHYRNIFKEIRDIRQNIVNLRHEQFHFKGNTNHVSQLRQEISALENCISKETCMVNALQDELKCCVNIHRWRILETMDPDAYSLVKRINVVTKRLVDHNEQIRKQNLRINDQEHVYVDIKEVSKHLPGLETPEERLYYEKLYAAKKQQLEFLKGEMYANEAQTAFFRGQVAELSKRMDELKKEYFDMCGKVRRRKSRKGAATSPTVRSGNNNILLELEGREDEEREEGVVGARSTNMGVIQQSTVNVLEGE